MIFFLHVCDSVQRSAVLILFRLIMFLRGGGKGHLFPEIPVLTMTSIFVVFRTREGGIR